MQFQLLINQFQNINLLKNKQKIQPSIPNFVDVLVKAKDGQWFKQKKNGFNHCFDQKEVVKFQLFNKSVSQCKFAKNQTKGPTFHSA